MEQGKVKVKKNVIVVLVIIFIMLVSASYYTVKLTFTPKELDEITVMESGKVGYTVCLNENDVFTDKCVSEKRSFISELINKVNININYSLLASNKMDYEYSYKITAITSANERGESDKVIYTNTEELVKESIKEHDKSALNVSKTIELDYNQYASLIEPFKKDYVLALDSSIKLLIEVNVKGTKDGYEYGIDKTFTSEVVIPLLEQTTNIEITNDATNSNYKLLEIETDEYNTACLLSDIVYKLDLLYLLFIVFLFDYVIPKKMEFEKQVYKILKDYDNIIVSTSEMPDISSLNKIKVKGFEELLDARENLNKPIIHYLDTNNKYAMFVIIDTNEVYLYMIFANKVNKKIN